MYPNRKVYILPYLLTSSNIQRGSDSLRSYRPYFCEAKMCVGCAVLGSKGTGNYEEKLSEMNDKPYTNQTYNNAKYGE